MSARAHKRFTGRLRLLLVLFLLNAALVLARTAQLQVGQHDELSRIARSQYLNDVKVPARRGHIFDRGGEPLAISLDVPSVYANPAAIVDARAAAKALAPVLAQSVASLYQRLNQDRLFVWLKRQVSPEVEAKVRALGIAGVATTKESRRFYPHRELASQVLGFTNVDAVGIEGVERSFEEVLKGEPQVVVTERDARGRAVLQGGLDPEQRTSGADVFLSLDLQIQHAAEAALAHAAGATRALAGMAVVLDVESGDVLANAVWPAFNPNVTSSARPAATRNRVVTDMFEPGSTIKPLVVAGALESRTVKSNASFFCENGSFEIADRTISDTKPHGWLNLTGIIQKSSNIGAAKIGETLGKQRLAEWLRAYGFGARTGISFSGEAAGIVRDPAKWSGVSVATISYGHGVAVTALQLALAYRVLAADGRYRAPRLVTAVRSPGGERLTVPLGEERQVLSRKTTQEVRAMLEAAVGPGGTGGLAAVPGYRVAGKTGTAQKPDLVTGGYTSDSFMAAFTGYLPAEAPRVVIAVVLDEPGTQHTGGAVAAPVFAEIGAAAMRVLGVLPNEPVAAPLAPVAREEVMARVQALESPVASKPAGQEGTVPSFAGLSAAEALARFFETDIGLELELLGSGHVVRQEPVAGTRLGKVERLTLVMAE